MNQKNFILTIDKIPLRVEIKDWAEQANGSVLVSLGETSVLATCVMADEAKEGLSFFPLSVEYLERYYAAGKIRGARYIRREGRPSDEAICNARLIDRTIRPLFPKELKREVQVIITVLSWDGKNDPDIPSLIAASLSLAISNIPWQGPVAALRVCQKNGQFLLNPDYETREKSSSDIIFAGLLNGKGEFLLNMIEGNCEEAPESSIFSAFTKVKKYLKEIYLFQEKIAKEIGKEKIVLSQTLQDPQLKKEVREFLGKKLEEALFKPKKEERIEAIQKLKEELTAFLEEKYPEEKKAQAFNLFEEEIHRLIHKNIIEKEKRPDGRGLEEIRNFECKVGVLPRTHGSGFFSRGQTKTLSILTLGAPGDVQLLEGMEVVGEKRFMHHYNFPPYAPGEIRPLRGPGRREIGHGMLAEKALLPLIPSFNDFPYTIRIVSEVLSSNGSTSMASVSSSSLALMDAGVPIKRHIAGIALGLMQNEKGEYKILTDIQGPEDHYGDMDFKIAGTNQGVTALQMDVKIKGIGEKILEELLWRAKKARTQILAKMEETISKPRPQLSVFAPRIYTLQINPEKIRDVIGPGGKTINEIIADTGVSIDIQPSGKIFVTSESEKAAEKAVSWIKNITREVKVGEIFEGKIVKTLDFGAFAEILPGVTGLIHISQLAPFRVKRVEDIVKVGDVVPVKVISIDEQGRINLSLKQIKNLSRKLNSFKHLKWQKK